MSDIKFAVPPWGFCPECVEKTGCAPESREHDLPDGSKLLELYCVHREVGATMYVKEGRPQRWLLVTPIDAIDWQERHVPNEYAVRLAGVIKRGRVDGK